MPTAITLVKALKKTKKLKLKTNRWIMKLINITGQSGEDKINSKEKLKID
jgi:hypothetical protein